MTAIIGIESGGFLIVMGAKRNVIYDEAYYKLYMSGLSLSEVAKKMNVTRQCVYKAFKNREFKLRTIEKNKTIEYDGKIFSMKKKWILRINI